MSAKGNNMNTNVDDNSNARDPVADVDDNSNARDPSANVAMGTSELYPTVGFIPLTRKPPEMSPSDRTHAVSSSNCRYIP